MNIKNRILGAFVAVVALCSTSCEDFLTQVNPINYIANSLNVMEPTLAGIRWQMGFADNGTSINIITASGKLTSDNYFIDNMTVEPQVYKDATTKGGGAFFSDKKEDKGQTYFYGNTELGCEHSEDGSKWYNAEWLDYIPDSAAIKLAALKSRAEAAIQK